MNARWPGQVSSMLKGTLTLAITILCFSSFAQFNDSTRYYLGYSLTGSYNKNHLNTSFVLSNSLQFKHKAEDLLYNLNLRHVLGKQQYRTVNNDFTGLFDVNRFLFFPGFYTWGLASYSSLFSVNVDHQVQIGAGIAYNLVNKKRFKLNLSDGIIYDFSQIRVSDSIPLTYGTYRNSVRLQVKLFVKEFFTLQSAVYVQHSLKTSHDMIIRGEGELILHLSDVIKGNMKVQYNQFSLTEQKSLFITWGILLNKYL
jgi:hypothetical protein